MIAVVPVSCFLTKPTAFQDPLVYFSLWDSLLHVASHSVVFPWVFCLTRLCFERNAAERVSASAAVESYDTPVKTSRTSKKHVRFHTRYQREHFCVLSATFSHSHTLTKSISSTENQQGNVASFAVLSPPHCDHLVAARWKMFPCRGRLTVHCHCPQWHRQMAKFQMSQKREAFFFSCFRVF